MQVETGVVDVVRMELKYCERCGGLLVRRSGEPRVYCALCEQRMGQVALAPRPNRKQVRASVEMLAPAQSCVAEGGQA
jgi:uncharacterized Zn finger protein (UPF0148 family)